MKSNGLTVGVTFYLHEGERSIWVNGGHQNAVFLVRLLEQCPEVERVIAINGGPGDTAPSGMMLDSMGFEFPRFEAVADKIDLLIECGAQIPAKHAVTVHENGGKVVGYKFGNAFVLDSEKLVAGKADRAVFNGTKFDAIWSLPQHAATCNSYWETCYRCPVVEVPHIWEPTFVDMAIEEMADKPDVSWGYEPSDQPKTIAVFEPNMNVVKMCVIPMIACELAYREAPGLIDKVYITNTDRLRGQSYFQHLYGQLDIAKSKARDGMNVCSCESRYNLAWFQAKYADVVFAWQWECALNYVYYEALYGHYPFVHNSQLLPDSIGYRYNHFDAHDGAQALLRALRTHDDNVDEYNATADAFVETLASSWPANVEAHSDVIAQLSD